MFEHESVLKNEAVEALSIRPDGIYIDCTLGGGGHSEQIVSLLQEGGQLIAFDQDIEALTAAKKRLAPYGDRITFIHSNFKHLKETCENLDVQHIDGILFDLGVSSPQFDHGERGFSYRHDARLDMRMNQDDPLTAHTIINEWPYERLVPTFFTYGEERFSKQIARRIERVRAEGPIDTTYELVEIIKEAIPAAARRKGGHPAKRIFQALRIAVNDELRVFEDTLKQAAEIISIEGRIAVITFHSLEDRICKQSFKKWSTEKPTPRNLPIIPEGHEPPFKLITRKPIAPQTEEVEENRRARSAFLRVIEKERKWDNDFL